MNVAQLHQGDALVIALADLIKGSWTAFVDEVVVGSDVAVPRRWCAGRAEGRMHGAQGLDGELAQDVQWLGLGFELHAHKLELSVGDEVDEVERLIEVREIAALVALDG